MRSESGINGTTVSKSWRPVKRNELSCFESRGINGTMRPDMPPDGGTCMLRTSGMMEGINGNENWYPS